MMFSASKKRVIFLILIAVFFFAVQIVSAQDETAVFIVADFNVRGISDDEMIILVDLVSYLIYESKDCLVMNRYERNKLLKGFGYNQTNLQDTDIYIEAADLLRADYLVTGSCIRDGDDFNMNFSLWDVGQDKLINNAGCRCESYEDIIRKSRSVVGDLVSEIENGAASKANSTGIFKSLYITTMTERMLVVLPEPGEGNKEETAAARFLVNQFIEGLKGNNKYSFIFSSSDYSTDNPSPEDFAGLLKKRDSNTLALVLSEGGRYYLVIYNPDFSERARLTLPLSGDRMQNAEELVRQMEEIPLMSVFLLIDELDKEIKIKDKLDLLLFNDKFISRKYWVNIHQSIVKPAVVNKFHPLFNMISLELDSYWFYSDLLGLSMGYAFSMGYPATLDSKLASHPLVMQHEIRFSPLVFRSSGPVSVVIELRAAFNIHNAYEIIYIELIDKYEFENKTQLMMFKTAVASGLLYSIDDNSSIFVNLAEICAVFPFNAENITYDSSNISGAIGGIGFIFRF